MCDVLLLHNHLEQENYVNDLIGVFKKKRRNKI